MKKIFLYTFFLAMALVVFAFPKPAAAASADYASLRIYTERWVSGTGWVRWNGRAVTVYSDTNKTYSGHFRTRGCSQTYNSSTGAGPIAGLEDTRPYWWSIKRLTGWYASGGQRTQYKYIPNNQEENQIGTRSYNADTGEFYLGNGDVSSPTAPKLGFACSCDPAKVKLETLSDNYFWDYYQGSEKPNYMDPGEGPTVTVPVNLTNGSTTTKTFRAIQKINNLNNGINKIQANATPSSGQRGLRATLSYSEVAHYTNVAALDGPVRYKWFFAPGGSGGYSSEARPVRTYSSTGTFRECVMAYVITGTISSEPQSCNSNDVLSTLDPNIQLHTAGYVDVVVTDSTIQGASCTFSDNSATPKTSEVPITVTYKANDFPAGTNYAWVFGDGRTQNTGTTNTVSHTFSSVGTFTATVNGNSCPAVTVTGPSGGSNREVAP